MTGISGVLARLIKSYRLENKLLEQKLRHEWETIVGRVIASHTIPEQIQYGRLYLWVDSSNWLNQLGILKPMLLQKINDHAQRRAFKDIRMRSGTPPIHPVDPPRPLHEQKPEPIQRDITPELETRIQEYLRPVEDLQLREVLRRVLIRSLSS